MLKYIFGNREIISVTRSLLSQEDKIILEDFFGIMNAKPHKDIRFFKKNKRTFIYSNNIWFEILKEDILEATGEETENLFQILIKDKRKKTIDSLRKQYIKT